MSGDLFVSGVIIALSCALVTSLIGLRLLLQTQRELLELNEKLVRKLSELIQGDLGHEKAGTVGSGPRDSGFSDTD